MSAPRCGTVSGAPLTPGPQTRDCSRHVQSPLSSRKSKFNIRCNLIITVYVYIVVYLAAFTLSHISTPGTRPGVPGHVLASRDTSWCPGTCPGVPRIVAGLRLHTTGRRRLFTYCHQHTLQSSHQHTVHPTPTFSLRRRRAISSDTRCWVDGFRIALCSELNQSSVILYNDTMTVPSRTYVSNDDVHSSTEYAKQLLIWLIVGGYEAASYGDVWSAKSP